MYDENNFDKIQKYAWDTAVNFLDIQFFLQR